uniref:Uncharacterized protein n=1 Tax=Anguilla anguilla TaxID=7936 RepID=A0A0E9PQ96_ANGAN
MALCRQFVISHTGQRPHQQYLQGHPGVHGTPVENPYKTALFIVNWLIFLYPKFSRATPSI